MPTATYDLIEEKVLGTAAASVTFSSIPGTYKDLVLEVISSISSGTSENLFLRFNSDSGTNYSITRLIGNGTAASSDRFTNETYAWGGTIQVPTLVPQYVNIMSYANTNVNKTVLIRSSDSSFRVMSTVCLWRSTSAITTLLVTLSGNTFPSGSTFRLWGVAG